MRSCWSWAWTPPDWGISELNRLEIHGMNEELAKLRGPLADMHAT